MQIDFSFSFVCRAGKKKKFPISWGSDGRLLLIFLPPFCFGSLWVCAKRTGPLNNVVLRLQLGSIAQVQPTDICTHRDTQTDAETQTPVAYKTGTCTHAHTRVPTRVNTRTGRGLVCVSVRRTMGLCIDVFINNTLPQNMNLALWGNKKTEGIGWLVLAAACMSTSCPRKKKKGCSVQTFLHCYNLALFPQTEGELCVRLKQQRSSAAYFYQPSGKNK